MRLVGLSLRQDEWRSVAPEFRERVSSGGNAAGVPPRGMGRYGHATAQIASAKQLANKIQFPYQLLRSTKSSIDDNDRAVHVASGGRCYENNCPGDLLDRAPTMPRQRNPTAPGRLQLLSV